MRPESTFATMPAAARFAVLFFALLGFGAMAYAAVFQMGFAPGRLFLLMAAAAICARAKVRLYQTSTISLLTSVVLLAVIKEGLASALIVGIFGVMVQTVVPSKRLVLHQLAFNFGMIAVTVSATWFTHQSLTAARIAGPVSTESTATLLASFVYFLGNSLSVSMIIALSKRVSMAEVWLKHFMYSAPSFLLAGLLSLGIVALMNSQGFAVVVSLVAVISIVYYTSIRLAGALIFLELDAASTR
jgi:hypothetical protein